MTTASLSAALRMPHVASVAAPAPLAHGVPAEPCAPKAAMRSTFRGGTDATIMPAFGSRRNGTEGGDRIGGITRPVIGSGWDRQEMGRLAEEGPMRG